MKDCCERDLETSHVSVGSGAQRQLVAKFRSKFMREAQMIAEMDHQHIVRVLDVFEGNGTAYYVMDNLTGGSLSSIVKESGPLDEAYWIRFLRKSLILHLKANPSLLLMRRQRAFSSN